MRHDKQYFGSQTGTDCFRLNIYCCDGVCDIQILTVVVKTCQHDASVVINAAFFKISLDKVRDIVTDAPNATVMSWRGIEGGIEAVKHKHDAIMTPSSFLYFD